MLSRFKSLPRNKIDFLVIGVQKCGTSSFNYQLRMHPDIGIPKGKELHFFDDDEIFISTPDYAEYHEKFRFWRRRRIYGETTPIYMYWKPCTNRIFSYNPKIKLLVLLRNPIKRAFSHWHMEFKRKTEPLSFAEAVSFEMDYLKKMPERQDRIRSYISRGLYGKQLQYWLSFFDRDQFHIIKQEDFFARPKDILEETFRFLSVRVQPGYQIKDIFFNTQKYEMGITKLNEEFLKDIFKDDIRLLSTITNIDFTDWIK